MIPSLFLCGVTNDRLEHRLRPKYLHTPLSCHLKTIKSILKEYSHTTQVPFIYINASENEATVQIHPYNTIRHPALTWLMGTATFIDAN
jgi:hypothetical protein